MHISRNYSLRRPLGLTQLRQTLYVLSSDLRMKTVRKTDVHCELTGLNVYEACQVARTWLPNTERELLSRTLKSANISPVTGIWKEPMPRSCCSTTRRFSTCLHTCR